MENVSWPRLGSAEMQPRGEELAEHQIFYRGWGPQGREATVAARDARTEVIRRG